jgi:hypothetical protein
MFKQHPIYVPIIIVSATDWTLCLCFYRRLTATQTTAADHTQTTAADHTLPR